MSDTAAQNRSAVGHVVDRTRSLEDTVVVVTGAGGAIGGAIARLVLEAGGRVVAGDLRPDALAPLRDAWGEDRLAVAVGDVRDEATADALVAAGVTAFGRVDSVVANAAVGFYGGVLDYSADEVSLMVDVNVKGTVWLSRAAVRQFRAQGDGGDIVILGSVAGLLIGGGEGGVDAGRCDGRRADPLGAQFAVEGVAEVDLGGLGGRVDRLLAAADEQPGDGAEDDDVAAAALDTELAHGGPGEPHGALDVDVDHE